MPKTESERYDTIVIGAGFAGLCAATRLQRAGQRVLLLEATERVGGRARSTADGADLGCGFLGVQHTFALSLVDELGLALIDYCKGAPKNPSSRSMTSEGLQDTRLDEAWFGIQGCKKDGPLVDRLGLLRGMLQWILLENLVNHRAPGTGPFARRLDRMTVSGWMDRLPMRPRHLDLIRLAVTAIWSTEPERMSLLYLLWYTATNGGLLAIANDQAGGPQQFGVRGGLGGMARTVADRFQGELRMQAPVTRVARGESGFVVTLGDGRTEMATDVVIAAAPSAVARQIAFEPPLPESTRRFLDQPMGHAIKAVLEYETRWWWDYPNGDKYQFYAGKAGGVFEWMLDTSEPDRSVYRFAVFLRAPAQDVDPNALLESVKSELFELTKDQRCLEVSRFECFDWAQAPYIGGGPVTICAPGALSSGPDRELSGSIHFAGAEYSDQFTGYVEGAIRSGARAAARILKVRPEPALSAGGVRWGHLALAAAAYAPVALAVELLRRLHRPASTLRG